MNRLNNSPTGLSERGVASIEIALLLPIFVAIFVGILATNLAVNASRALQWAVGEALLENGLYLSPRVPESGGDAEFSMTYYPNADPSNRAVFTGIRGDGVECQNNMWDVKCAAWWVLGKVAQGIHSSQQFKGLERVEVTLRYSDFDAEVNVSPELNRFRKVHVVARAHFDPEKVGLVRRVSGIGTLLPSLTVSRTEAFG